MTDSIERQNKYSYSNQNKHTAYKLNETQIIFVLLFIYLFAIGNDSTISFNIQRWQHEF